MRSGHRSCHYVSMRSMGWQGGMWRAFAIAAVALVVACTVVGVQLDLAAPGSDQFGSAAAGTIPGLAMTIPGALLLWRLGPHPIALVLTGFGVLWALDGPAAGLVNLALATGADSPLTDVAFWYYARFGAILLLPVQLILLLFPDGRLPRGRWRIVAIVSLALTLLMPFSFLLAPAEVLAAGDPVQAALLARFDPALPTLPLPDAVWATLLGAAFPALGLGTALALAVTIGRRRGATSEQRAQLRWLIWAGIVFLALVLASRIMPPMIGDIVFSLGVAFVSVAILVAVTRHGLYAIDRLLSWTIVYAILLVGVIAVDVGLYLALGTVFDDRVTLLVALVIVILVYTPLRDRLFRLASRWVNGDRVDPYDVVSRLVDRLDTAAAPDEQAAVIAEAVAKAFASGHVEVQLDRPDGTALTAAYGTATPHPTELALEHHGVTIGRIRMQAGRRPTVSARDRRLLSDIVRLAAAALRNAETSDQLQQIREGLVTAREEERARLRRELHDGLGPLLSAIRLRLETSRNLATKDPAQALAVLDAAIDESREVVDEVRRLVHDLRPPALDDLGLVRAIAQTAHRLSDGTRIRVDADDLPPLSAAVEVAAYRIAAEALTNVVRHANASHAVVRLIAQPAALVVEIADDGTGMPAAPTAGVGLVSLRARAAELGGGVVFLPAPQRGTLVRATLPLRTAAPPSAAADSAVLAAEPTPTRGAR